MRQGGPCLRRDAASQVRGPALLATPLPAPDRSAARSSRPTALAEQAEILAEQRRLFSVALSRCTEILIISSAIINIPVREARLMGAAVSR